MPRIAMIRTAMPAAPTPQQRRPPRWPALLAWGLWALALLALPVLFWVDHLLRQAGRPELVLLGASSSIPYVLSGLSAATIGAVRATRRPHPPVGWLLLALGLSVAVDGVANGYVAYGAVARPGSLPAARQVAVYADNATPSGGCASPSCCCSPRPGRCPRPAGGGGRGSWRSRRRHCWAPGRCCPDRSIRRSSRSPAPSPCTFWSGR